MSAFLKDLEKFIETQPFEIIRASVIHADGTAETLEGVDSNPCQNTYSVAKLFITTAIGILYDRGVLKLDEKVCDILKEYVPAEGMDERWYNNTVEDALTHRLGFPGGFLDIDTNPVSTFGEDFLHYAFTHPLAYEPGTESRYSDGAHYVLSRIITAKTGEKAEDFLWKNLLWKMGFQEVAWSHCPHGYPMGATGLYIRSDDMVKLGALYVNDGVYNGERFISEEWCRLVREHGYSVDWDETHSYYFKGGMCGQKLLIDPVHKRAFAMQSYGGNSDIVTKWVAAYEN